MMKSNALLQSWDALCARAEMIGGHDLGLDLLNCYSEPHRVYHNVEHLASVIDLLTQAEANDRLIMAAWFHDAIYRPGATDNEARSADMARRRLRALGCSPASIKAVCDAVLATASHRSQDNDVAALLDADLSILGTSAEAYRAYAAAIRKEFHDVPAAVFRAGRLAFIEAMLKRPNIYETTFFRQHFEVPARKNLEAEADLLRTTSSD
ncbi:HD domain-containing protein [Nevskia soli]|uniref:HD domain-containing protein n=1 Tax=Nevskia soli TaxID=418856 RepID=UPI00068EF222|nr:hypothetical protein [Nevskia soli]